MKRFFWMAAAFVLSFFCITGMTAEATAAPAPRYMHIVGYFQSDYIQNEEDLDLANGVLRVRYTDGSYVDYAMNDPAVTVSGYDKTINGNQNITFSCMGLTTDTVVTVFPRSQFSGTCGSDLRFQFDDTTGTLTITGSGAMEDYSWDTDRPWHIYAGRIRKVALPDTLTALGKQAFRGCVNLTQIDLPDGIQAIPDAALEECHVLTSLKIPGSVKYIGIYAFSGSALTSLELPEGLETIDIYAFMSCYDLQTVVLPESLKILGGGAFVGCESLKNINLPETLESISWMTFSECTGLQEVDIPQSVTEIAYGAFSACTAVDTVTFAGSAPTTYTSPWGALPAFEGVTADAWYPGDDATWTQTAKDALGGNLTWKAVEDFETVRIPGGETSGAQVTPPEGGWKEGSNTFTVSCSVPCMVAVSHDGGKTYARLTASTVQNGYSFTADSMTASSMIGVVVMGDATGDGELTNADITKARGVFAQKTSVDPLQLLALDANGDGKFTNADITKLRAVNAGKTTLSW